MPIAFSPASSILIPDGTQFPGRGTACPGLSIVYTANAAGPMLREMRQKLAQEIAQLSHELNVVIPQAIAQAVELGDLRENSEYKAALERQQFVQARLGQLHARITSLGSLSNHETPSDRVGLGSTVTVVDLKTKERETYVLVVAEMMDIDLGHISLGSPLGLALANKKVGDEIELRLPRGMRQLKVVELETMVQER